MGYDEENLKNQFIPSWDTWRKYVEEGVEQIYDEFNNVYDAIWYVQGAINRLKMYIHQIKLTFPDFGNVIYLRILTASDKAYTVENVDTAIAACGSATSPIPCTGAYKHTLADSYNPAFSIYKGSEQTLSKYTLTYLNASTGIVEVETFLPVVSDSVIPAFAPDPPIS